MFYVLPFAISLPSAFRLKLKWFWMQYFVMKQCLMFYVLPSTRLIFYASRLKLNYIWGNALSCHVRKQCSIFYVLPFTKLDPSCPWTKVKSQSISNIEKPLCFTFKKIKNIKHMYFQNKGDKGKKSQSFVRKILWNIFSAPLFLWTSTFLAERQLEPL